VIEQPAAATGDPPTAVRPVVVLVEDDEVIGQNLSRAFEDQFDVRWSVNGLQGFGTMDDADLVVLDLGLPDVDGLELCRRIADTWPRLPVLILTARQDEVEVVSGLEAGAVDYVTKPFRLAELIARIKAHLRTSAPPSSSRIVIGSMVIEADARRVTVDGVEVPLRPKELDLLLALAERPGSVITRDELMRGVWDEHWYGSTKTLDVHMTNLRRKLSPGGRPACTISTLRGVGFRLESS
jgi:DNA-binding response OmpR family regulator